MTTVEQVRTFDAGLTLALDPELIQDTPAAGDAAAGQANSAVSDGNFINVRTATCRLTPVLQRPADHQRQAGEWWNVQVSGVLN